MKVRAKIRAKVIDKVRVNVRATVRTKGGAANVELMKVELNRSEGSAVDYANHGGAEVRDIVRADQGGSKLELKLELTSELDIVLKVELKLEPN